MKILLILLTTLMLDANSQYADGHYQEAADLYQEIIAQDPTAEAYYNLGNARFKQGELAQAILAYERCLRIDPTNKDAKYNLRFAQSRIVDNIEDTSTFFVSNWLKHIRNAMHERTWVILSIISFWLLLAGLLSFLLLQSISVRKTGLATAVICTLLTIIFGVNALSLHHRDSAQAEAVITQGVVNAKSSPDKSGTDLFTLHEGTTVTIEETIGDWCQIQVGNHIGWIRLTNLERI